MKSLDLNPLQEIKLIKMCKKLFPKYKEWEYSAITPGYLEYDTFDSLEEDIEIHWFEFCIKYLIPKLSDSIQSTVDMRILFCELPNPVDYLYEHFKKLK